MEALGDLRLGHTGLGAQLTLDVFTNGSPRPCEVARHRGLVLEKQTARLGQRQLLCIVAAQAQAVARLESGHRLSQGTANRRQVAGPIGVGCGGRRRNRGRGLLLGQRLQTALGTQTIHVPLREHRAQPGGEAASSVKIAKQRLPALPAVVETVELAIERVGEFARTASRGERVGRAVEPRPLLADEVFPCRLVSRGAGTGEREVLQMQRGQAPIQLSLRRRLGAERAIDARIERVGKEHNGHVPASGVRLAVKPFDLRVIQPPRSHGL